jgi:hypothetical protein
MAMSRSFGGTSLTTSPADHDFAAGDVLEPRDHAQRRGLAAARRADQHHELLVGLMLQVDAAHGLDVSSYYLTILPHCYAIA